MDHDDESVGDRGPGGRRRDRVRWLLVAVAVVALAAGVVLEEGLLIAAGLLLVGTAGPWLSR
jgi:hypothetical protein